MVNLRNAGQENVLQYIIAVGGKKKHEVQIQQIVLFEVFMRPNSNIPALSSCMVT